jgi:4-carboxymuconolactone decarboxylase
MTKARRIPDPARQIATLVVGAKLGAAYEIYAHGAVALAFHKMSAACLATIAAGNRPDGLNEEEGAAADHAVEAQSNPFLQPSTARQTPAAKSSG